jgi:Uma2 family endonuclease
MATATAPATSRSTALAGETLHNVDWATYCKLRDDPANDHLRMTYLDGDLTIESGRPVHLIDSHRIMVIIVAVARAWRVRFHHSGDMTLFEGDDLAARGVRLPSFEGMYFGDNIKRVRGKKVTDLEVDPPPSLVLEVDKTKSSKTALPTYARIGVPEVWRFDAVDRTLRFYRLAGDHFEEVVRSLGLPRLTPSLVLEALAARAQEPDDIDWFDWLDRWARTLPEPD